MGNSAPGTTYTRAGGDDREVRPWHHIHLDKQEEDGGPQKALRGVIPAPLYPVLGAILWEIVVKSLQTWWKLASEYPREGPCVVCPPRASGDDSHVGIAGVTSHSHVQ